MGLTKAVLEWEPKTDPGAWGWRRFTTANKGWCQRRAERDRGGELLRSAIKLPNIQR